MRIQDGFVLRRLKGEYIVVGEGLAQVDFNHILHLNASAAYLWEQLSGRDFTEDDMVNLLVEKYKIPPDTARADALHFSNALQEQGILIACHKI